MLPRFGLSLTVLAAAAAATASGGNNCADPSWEQYGSKCYWLSDYEISADSLVKECSLLWPVGTATPVSIHSLDENSFVAETVAQGEWVWVGLHRQDAHANFTWMDGSPMDLTNWYTSEPNYNGGEACVSMNDAGHVGFWFDDGCDTTPKKFICEGDEF